MSKPKPTGVTIKSKWGVFNQLIVVPSLEIVDKYSAILGHFTSNCLQYQIPNVDICCDHSTDPLKCAWANAKLFQASQNLATSNQILLSEAMVPFQNDFVLTNDFIFIIQVLPLLYFFWHYWMNNRNMGTSSKSALLLMGSND